MYYLDKVSSEFLCLCQVQAPSSHHADLHKYSSPSSQHFFLTKTITNVHQMLGGWRSFELMEPLDNNKTTLTADWLAQLVEHRTTVREVSGSSPRPDQHSGS